ncbi:GNAT family N-acetyltransferase [Arcobacter porcinus]|uniref:GNAT family N-acetyltransferase n=1 Tax=Arcobacter porcinus TaxID=1935204 RepID=UPI0008250CF4|nr:GNAT family N-acetyltransferase [Arcobacter porcinus]OCL85606.1 ribosomal-protein-alanine N-acetyltransferase [Arcobacter porcinus]
MFEIVEYTKEFLPLSWKWLNDKEIKNLTMTPDFSKEDQNIFFNSLESRQNYKIFGIEFNGLKIGACGLKNIENTKAEYWGYIGEKEYWGRGFGKLILKEMINLATKEQISIIYLKVGKNNQRAIKLYEKFGFVNSMKENNYYMMDKNI